MLDKNIQWTEKLKLTCICNMHPCNLDFQFNCNLTPQVFLLSASLCCSLSCFPNDPHTSIYSCPSCIALVHSSLLHHIVACTLAGTWELQETRCSSVGLLCVPSFLFYVHKVLLGVLVLQLKNWILYHLKEIRNCAQTNQNTCLALWQHFAFSVQLCAKSLPIKGRSHNSGFQIGFQGWVSTRNLNRSISLLLPNNCKFCINLSGHEADLVGFLTWDPS